LSTGVLASATIERTKDRKDYKAVFHKTKKMLTFDTALPEESNRGGEVEKKALPEESPLTAQAAELVSRFYKLFHRVDRPYPMSKEIAHAVGLISRQGFDRAKYIVDFSRDAAERTNYAPQTFGGILQYESRAMKEFDYYERLKEIGRAELEDRKAREQRDRAEREEIDKRLTSLSEGEYKRLYQTVERDFGAQFPQVMATKGSLFESAIRARMARLLEKGVAPENGPIEFDHPA
jgi:hypothetical protein